MDAALMPKSVHSTSPSDTGATTSIAEQKGASQDRPAPGAYHHGDLHAGLLAAAERILLADGIQGLTLRAAAREAGVSHAAPKNHFGDLTGLLSELAAVGFARFNAAMEVAMSAAAPSASPMATLGTVYVRFARTNPGLFLLMFRAERLDFSRPALRDASSAAIERLAGATAPIAGGRAPETKSVAPSGLPPLSVAQAAGIVQAWAMVHGLSLLLIDGRLKPIVDRLPPGTTEADLLKAIREGSP
jgi:AcrR family transcriptional regulator